LEAVKSASRALSILELLTTLEGPATFTEISERLDLPRSSLSGLLSTMTDASWLRLDPQTRAYRLGIRVMEAGNAYLRAVDLPTRAIPIMKTICDQMDETVQLAVLDGRFNVYIAKLEGNQALRLASEVGRRLPAHATGLGKVMLAYLPESDLRARFHDVELEVYTKNTLATFAALQKELARIRSLGFGVDNEEYSVGVRCVAAPVRDHTGVVVTAMSVSVPLIRFDRERRARARELVVAAAAQLSAELGYDPESREDQDGF
jgi:DNA-binding IclR family transcriptional regulator